MFSEHGRFFFGRDLREGGKEQVEQLQCFWFLLVRELVGWADAMQGVLIVDSGRCL